MYVLVWNFQAICWILDKVPSPFSSGSSATSIGLQVYYHKYVWWVNDPTVGDYIDLMFDKERHELCLILSSSC